MIGIESVDAIIWFRRTCEWKFR